MLLIALPGGFGRGPCNRYRLTTWASKRLSAEKVHHYYLKPAKSALKIRSHESIHWWLLWKPERLSLDFDPGLCPSINDRVIELRFHLAAGPVPRSCPDNVKCHLLWHSGIAADAGSQRECVVSIRPCDRDNGVLAFFVVVVITF